MNAARAVLARIFLVFMPGAGGAFGSVAGLSFIFSIQLSTPGSPV